MTPRQLSCLVGLTLLFSGGLSTADAECRIRYEYSVTAEYRPRVDQTLHEGESLHLARARLSFVENIGEHPVRLFITGIPTSVLVLQKGERTPAQGV
ncbi:MAG: hypothetical protein EA371_14630, partial [Gammaproteobacteria bacterium]